MLRIDHLVFGAFGILFMFFVTYFWTRSRLTKNARLDHVTFLFNTMIMLLVLWLYQVWLLKRLDIYSTGLVASTLLMLVAALMHHISILLDKKILKFPIIGQIHGPISHLLFFIPFGINSGMVGSALVGLSQGVGDIMWAWSFILLTVGGSIAGILVGLNKIKLPYK
jgi:hypothetical protein